MNSDDGYMLFLFILSLLWLLDPASGLPVFVVPVAPAQGYRMPFFRVIRVVRGQPIVISALSQLSCFSYIQCFDLGRAENVRS